MLEEREQPNRGQLELARFGFEKAESSIKETIRKGERERVEVLTFHAEQRPPQQTLSFQAHPDERRGGRREAIQKGRRGWKA